jgi:putative phage-type endonuclease
LPAFAMHSAAKQCTATQSKVIFMSEMKFDSAIAVADQRSANWYALRSSSIGSSEAAEAVGLSQWGTPLSLYRKKLGLDPPDEENDQMIEGRIMEGAIIRLFRIKSGIRVQTRRPPMYRSIKHPWMTASPDALTVTPEGVECKKTDRFDTNEWGQTGTDEIPNPVVVQAQHQMSVLGIGVVFVPVLIHGRYRCYKVNRNERFISNLIEAERAFWKCIETQTPPDPTWEHATTPSLIRNMFRVNGHIVDLSDEAKLLWRESEQLAGEAKEIEAKRQALRSRVLFEMAEAEFGLLGDGTMIRRNRQTIKEHVVKEFEKMDVRRMKCPK